MSYTNKLDIDIIKEGFAINDYIHNKFAEAFKDIFAMTSTLNDKSIDIEKEILYKQMVPEQYLFIFNRYKTNETLINEFNNKYYDWEF